MLMILSGRRQGKMKWATLPSNSIELFPKRWRVPTNRRKAFQGPNQHVQNYFGHNFNFAVVVDDLVGFTPDGSFGEALLLTSMLAGKRETLDFGKVGLVSG